MSTENAQENVAQSAAPLRITISEVLSLLSQGKNRKEIAEHFGRTQTEMNKLVWSHPKLKGRKIKKQYTGIELEDDTEDINDVAQVEEQVTDVQEVAHVPAPAVASSEVFGENVAEVPGVPTSDWN